jgi:hypothetical protein
MTRLDNTRRPKVVPAVATGTGLRLEPKFSVPAQTLKDQMLPAGIDTLDPWMTRG